MKDLLETLKTCLEKDRFYFKIYLSSPDGDERITLEGDYYPAPNEQGSYARAIEIAQAGMIWYENEKEEYGWQEKCHPRYALSEAIYYLTQGWKIRGDYTIKV